VTVSDPIPAEAFERVRQAMLAFRQGKPDAVPCWFCGEPIQAAGSKTYVVVTCPCKKTTGHMHFWRED
jgi:hypothetical protein